MAGGENMICSLLVFYLRYPHSFFLNNIGPWKKNKGDLMKCYSIILMVGVRNGHPILMNNVLNFS